MYEQEEKSMGIHMIRNATEDKDTYEARE